MDYPNLESCRVVLRPERQIHKAPIRLPSDCLVQAMVEVPKPLDFSTEHRVLKKKVEREREYGLSLSSSQDDLRNSLLARMKSLTNASEDVCISLLQRHSYDLEESVEAYLSNSQTNLG